MGRILTSPTLNVPEYPNVFAIGDCSRPKKTPYPGTAQVAIQMATVAAWNVYATLANEKNDERISRENESLKLLPFTYLNLGEMLTLGRNDATISTIGGIEIDGPGASWLRRLIYAVRMPTARQRLSAAVDGTGRKLARGALGVEKTKRKGMPEDWK
jgi:NADH dehydrogenase